MIAGPGVITKPVQIGVIKVKTLRSALGPDFIENVV